LGNENSNRRRFIRKLAMLGAVGAIAAVLSTEKTLIPTVQASPVALEIDIMNTGTATTRLDSSVSFNPAFYARATTTTGYADGVWGVSDAPGLSYGVCGAVSSTGGIGVFGLANASSGTTYGMYGRSDSTSGIGVQGYAPASSGTTYGMYGRSDSTSGIGVQGYAPASSGYTTGVYGQSASSDGMGVCGSGQTGVYGGSTSGSGVMGFGTGTTGVNYGVYGVSQSSSGIGVFGKANNAGAKPIVARGWSGQTANLQEWQNSAGTALSVVDKDGKLGVGTATPTDRIHVVSPSGYDANIRFEGDGNVVGFILKNTGTGGRDWRLRANKNTILPFGGLTFTDDTALAVRMCIDAAGNIGIGTTSPAFKLDVAGAAHASSFPTSSDIRFKDDITPLTNVLDRLKQLRAVSFQWNPLYASLGRATEGRQIGLIAQEVEAAFPELVSKWTANGVNDYRGVDYGRFSAILLEAVKELYEQVKELREQIARVSTGKAT